MFHKQSSVCHHSFGIIWVKGVAAQFKEPPVEFSIGGLGERRVGIHFLEVIVTISRQPFPSLWGLSRIFQGSCSSGRHHTICKLLRRLFERPVSLSHRASIWYSQPSPNSPDSPTTSWLRDANGCFVSLGRMSPDEAILGVVSSTYTIACHRSIWVYLEWIWICPSIFRLKSIFLAKVFDHPILKGNLGYPPFWGIDTSEVDGIDLTLNYALEKWPIALVTPSITSQPRPSMSRAPIWSSTLGSTA